MLARIIGYYNYLVKSINCIILWYQFYLLYLKLKLLFDHLDLLFHYFNNNIYNNIT